MVQNIPTGGPTASPSLRAITKSAQSVPSSTQPVGEPRTINPTGEASVDLLAEGMNPLPALGGGFCPPYGVAGSDTTFGGVLPLKSPPPASTVVQLPNTRMPRTQIVRWVYRQRFGFFPQKINSTRCGIEVVGVKHQQTFIGRARNRLVLDSPRRQHRQVRRAPVEPPWSPDDPDRSPRPNQTHGSPPKLRDAWSHSDGNWGRARPDRIKPHRWGGS